MSTAYFSIVRAETSWSSLQDNAHMQKIKKRKPTHYNTLSEISISAAEFDFLEKNIAKPNQCYLQYTHNSIADDDGIWSCIVIRCGSDSRMVILYTAGRTFPLYAAVC